MCLSQSICLLNSMYNKKLIYNRTKKKEADFAKKYNKRIKQERHACAAIN